MPISHLGVMLLGDTHCNQKHLFSALGAAQTAGIKKIIQLGDFGFFWAGQDHTKPLSEMLESLDMKLDFLDGNHEDFNFLGDLRDLTEPMEIRPRIRYLPRGCVWEENGARVMALGGATSVDAYNRTPGLTWFEEESLTASDIQRAIANGPVDVLLTHDAPPTALLENQLSKSAHFWPKDLLDLSTEHRTKVGKVVDALQPKLVVHGHYHWRYSTVYVTPKGKRVSVVGLSHDMTGTKSWLGL